MMGLPLVARLLDVNHTIRLNGRIITANSFPDQPSSTTLYPPPTASQPHSNNRQMATQPGKPALTPSSEPPKPNSSSTASSGNPPVKQTSTATSTNSVSKVS